jgi:hypothetical protein
LVVIVVFLLVVEQGCLVAEYILKVQLKPFFFGDSSQALEATMERLTNHVR